MGQTDDMPIPGEAGNAEPDVTAERPLDDLAVSDEERLLSYEWLARRSTLLLALRPTRIQIAALVLLSVFALGPLVALYYVLQQPLDPSQTLLDEAASVPDDVGRVSATILGVNAVQGEMRVRLLVVPPGTLTDAGRLTTQLSLRVNDARGLTSYTYVASEVPGPIEVSLALTGGSVSRYPFDSYESTLALLLSPDDEADDEASAAIPLDLSVTTTVTDFELTAARAEGDDAPSTLTVADITVQRTPATTVYASGIMILMWGLAVSGVLVAWSIVIWRVETPMWVYAYFVGVLFALPPLRAALPGSPPTGTLVDFVAFYWSVATIGATLLLVTGIWIRRARLQRPDKPPD